MSPNLVLNPKQGGCINQESFFKNIAFKIAKTHKNIVKRGANFCQRSKLPNFAQSVHSARPGLQNLQTKNANLGKFCRVFQ
jgi:hypothetical protein